LAFDSIGILHKWPDEILINSNMFLFLLQYFVVFNNNHHNILCWQVYEKFTFDSFLRNLHYAFFEKQNAFCRYVNKIGLRLDYLK